MQPEAKIQDLQFLRGVAILLVLCAHWMLPEAMFRSAGYSNPGWTGVQLFFVLSGYVVTRSLIRQDFDIASFTARRVFRLYPALLVFIGLMFATNYLTHATMPDFASVFWIEPAALFRHGLAMLIGSFPLTGDDLVGLNGHVWSLSIEMRFYAALACVALVAQVASGNSRRAVAVIIIIVAFTMFVLFVADRVGVYFDRQKLPFSSQFRPYAGMALGVLLAFVPRTACLRISRAVGFLWPLWLFAPLVAIALSQSISVPAPPGNDLRIWVIIFMIANFGILVMVAAEGSISRSIPRMIARPLCWLGDRSYTVFLIHYCCFGLAWILTYWIAPSFAGGERWMVAQVFTSALVIAALAELIYRYVELPMIRLGYRATSSTKLTPVPDQRTISSGR
jgi:peptidoglycan/LPS O-acetylase OafA/YrhL